MRKLMLIASVAAMAIATPALAQGRGNGQGHGARNGQVVRTLPAPRARVRTDARTSTDWQRGRNRARTNVIDRNGDGVDDRAQSRRYGGAVCPPGLANRTPACVPPGQARRSFREGQRLPESYRYYTDYDALIGRVPEAYRSQIPTGQRYIYRDNSVYVVDPTTRVVTNIIDLLG